MKLIFFALALVFSNTASATPGDVSCEAERNGKKIKLLIGYDFHGQTVPSLLEISEAGSVVFVSADVEEDLVHSRTWTASDEESTATIQTSKQTGSDFTSAVLTVVTDSGLFKVENLEMSCNK